MKNKLAKRYRRPFFDNKSSILICIMAPAFILASCSFAPEVLSRSQRQVITKAVSEPEQLRINQEPTPTAPTLKFTAPVTYEYIDSETIETIKKTQRTSTSLIGFGVSILGAIVFAANPAPDPQSYTEDKFESLNMQKLQARQIGFGIALAGAAVGFLGGNKSAISERATGQTVTIKREAAAQPKNYSVWLQCDNLKKEKIGTGAITEKEGSFDLQNALSTAITAKEKLPQTITLITELDNGKTHHIEMPIGKTLSLINNQLDWSADKPDGKKTPSLVIEAIDDITARPGETIITNIKIENQGAGPACQLAAYVKAGEDLFDGRKNKILLFGRIPSGGAMTCPLIITLPKEAKLTMTPITISFEEFNGFAPKPIRIMLYAEK